MFNQTLEELQILVEREVMARGGIKKGFEYRFPCPMPDHPDENPSANYNSEKGVWLCRSCSSSGGLLKGKNPLCELLGIETNTTRLPRPGSPSATPVPKPPSSPSSTLVAPKAEPKPPPPKQKSRTNYELLDPAGNYVATHVRLDFHGAPKKMWWEINGKPGLGGIPTSKLPLYGSERLSEREPGDDTWLYLCEGEKTTDAVRGLGLRAVGTTCGAHVVPDREVLQCLDGLRVACCPDVGGAGEAHIQSIMALLQGIAADTRRFQPEGMRKLGEGADLADWIVAVY